MSFKNDRITGIPAPLPLDYDRQASFTDWETNNPGSPPPASYLEGEFNAIQQALDETQDRLQLIQDDDGSLLSESVGNDQLKSEVLVGANAPTPWATATRYAVSDTVIQSNIWYYCQESHVSDPSSFATDLAAGKWRVLLDLSSVLTVEAAHWANYPVDDLVPEGDLVDDYSALHHATKAAISAQAAAISAQAAAISAQAAEDAELNVDQRIAAPSAGDAGKVAVVDSGGGSYAARAQAVAVTGTDTLAASIGWDAYSTHQAVTIKAAATNTGAVTLNLDSLGAKSVTLSDGSALPAGSLEANKLYSLWYDGTNFVVLNPYATESESGMVKRATEAEAIAGKDADKYMTPATDHAAAYELARPKWYDADLAGSKLALGAVGDVALAYIGGDNVAFYDATNENLAAYTWSDATSTWAQSGNPLTIASTATPSMAAIAKDTIAFGQRNGTNFELSTYSWDGTNWSKTGNTLAINIGSHTPYMAALSSATVAVVFASANEIRAFGWDGTNWTQAGNTLSIPSVGSGDIAALTSSRVCVSSSTQETIQSYFWDGTDFAADGDPLGVGAGLKKLTAISDTDVAAIDTINNLLVTYGETSSGWRTFDLSFPIDAVVAPSITTVSRTGVAVVDVTDENLARYELKSITSAAPVSASIVA